jgi:hypothetical protein
VRVRSLLVHLDPKVCFNAEMFAADLSKAADDSDETKINVPLEYPRVPWSILGVPLEYPRVRWECRESTVRVPAACFVEYSRSTSRECVLLRVLPKTNPHDPHMHTHAHMIAHKNAHPRTYARTHTHTHTHLRTRTQERMHAHTTAQVGHRVLRGLLRTWLSGRAAMAMADTRVSPAALSARKHYSYSPHSVDEATPRPAPPRPRPALLFAPCARGVAERVRVIATCVPLFAVCVYTLIRSKYRH